ncbi:hypothetical protein GE061_010137 [Apolygus lucorum]|uniref:CCHC-type domain-containing protein n=1 Tax=Apolygus lucorum TaxID=248454 RepID=A0A8S9Y6C6_APOLU|nr:hypothetical protein GE061_010137 [Apolygus lucorum]
MSTSNHDDPEPRDVALEAVAKAMSRLEFVLGNRPTESTTEQIPRSVLMEVDPWDPDDVEAVAIGTYLEIFDGITRDLADNLRIQLLRIKLRGSAKTFLLDNGHLLEGKECYPALRRALIRWYGRDDPEKAAEQLWTMQKSEGETFRQFAERVRHTASRASRVEGIYMDATQTRTWIAARSVKAFLKGIPGHYAGFFVNNPPASLEEAMKKAEQLEDALEPREADRWNVARIQVQDKRCFRCRELGHIASGCPNIPRPPTPPPQRRNAMGSPQKPCSYCGSTVHFPAHCLKNPKNFPCDYCGLYGHKESECRVKTSHYADEPMCDYCGYYGHLEADCPQKTESCMRREAVTRLEPRKVLALTSEAYEQNPHQAVALRTEKKVADSPPVSTPQAEEADVCLPAVDSPFKQTMRIRVNLSGHERVLIVDTGAQISVLTHPVPNVPIVPTRILAWGADGQPMPFLGQQRLEVTIGPIRLTHAFRIFARDHSGLDLLGLDLLRRIPASIHLDSCEVRMTHPQTGQSVVISDVITGYLSPARPVPMPNREQPMRPRIAVVKGSHAFDTAHLLDPVDMEVSPSDDCPILDPSEEFPTEDLDEPIPDLLGVLQHQLQHLPTTDANYTVMSGGKNMHAMFKDVERKMNEGLSRDESQFEEPGEVPALPRPRGRNIEPSAVLSDNVDVDREWSILESGVDMMCNATNAEDRKHGWHRYTSALKFLKGCTRGRQPIASPTIDVDSLADALARKLVLPPVTVPTPREIASEVLNTVKPYIPPANPNLAVQIAEVVTQLQSPTYSPVHDAAAIADAILERLRGRVDMSLCVPARITEAPPAPEPLQQEEMTEDLTLAEESDQRTTDGGCIACGQQRTRHSRQWCEACRVFLRRSRKAAMEGRPIRCTDLRHQQNPDTTNCRGCRAQRLHALADQASHPEDSDDADEGIGFRRGGECNPRVPPLRLTVDRASFKRARARSASSPPAAPPASPGLPGPSFRQPTPVAPPSHPPPPAHAQKRRSAPPKPKDPHDRA